MNALIFVYGTLRRGLGNHFLLRDSRYVAEAVSSPRYSMVDLQAFPGILPFGMTSIVGEVYEVRPEVLADLDRLEGCPCFYNRQEIDLPGYEGVEAYFLAQPGSYVENTLIKSGDWKNK